MLYTVLYTVLYTRECIATRVSATLAPPRAACGKAPRR